MIYFIFTNRTNKLASKPMIGYNTSSVLYKVHWAVYMRLCGGWHNAFTDRKNRVKIVKLKIK